MAQIVQPLPIGPASSLDIHWDWTAWLGSDTIAAFSVTGSVGLALSSITASAGVVNAWCAPQGLPPAGTVLQAVCQITTASTPPRVDSRTITLIIQSR